MSQETYIQPASCVKDQYYYLKVSGNGREAKYLVVRFVGYRPHPAEILIDDGNQIRMVHRSLLFIKHRADGRID